jgi:hypothetical protein
VILGSLADEKSRRPDHPGGGFFLCGVCQRPVTDARGEAALRSIDTRAGLRRFARNDETEAMSDIPRSASSRYEHHCGPGPSGEGFNKPS